VRGRGVGANFWVILWLVVFIAAIVGLGRLLVWWGRRPRRRARNGK